MWPWEHAIFGYLIYSLLSRAWYREPPGDRETLAVVFGAVLPDLVDKPLAWQFGVVESGYAIAHSAFVAVPLAVAAGVLARRLGRASIGVAFGTGHLLHLAGDVIPIYLESGEWAVGHLLWPVVVTDGSEHAGVVEGVRDNLAPYLETALALEPTPNLLFQAAIAAGAALLWIVDGTPGWRPFYRGLVRTARGTVRSADSNSRSRE